MSCYLVMKLLPKLLQPVCWIWITDPAFFGWIRIRWTTDPDADPVIWQFQWIPGKIWSDLLFWSLKIRQVVQKLWFFSLDSNFWPTNGNFLQTYTILRCYPDFKGWNRPKKIDFLTKSTQLWRLITFEPLDRFSKFKKVKHSKFQALSIGSGSGSAKTSWIRIRIRILKSGSNTLILTYPIMT